MFYAAAPMAHPPRLTATIWAGITVTGLGQNPAPFNLTLYLDPLAAIFVVLVSFFTTCVAVYSVGWLTRSDPLRSSVAGGLNLFAGAMLLVVVVNNAFWLLLALEMVTLASAYLILYRGRRGGSFDESRTAVQTYLVTSQLGTVCLAAAILIIGVHYQTLDLGQFRQAGQLLPSPHVHLAFLLTLIGLGIRAGMTPFHFWVPIAHPQLPTNTHALMSGVMLKLAIYLMIRFFFEFLKPVVWWWGALLLLLAGLTALINVFFALISRDLKRALAYHSVENMGLILVGVALALLFTSQNFSHTPALSKVVGLALLASLLHTFNHATFKTLLFLSTGSIENRTGMVIMDKLGGLLRLFPWTGATFLFGAVAIAGFPPFNGFISEWLTFQSLFASMDIYRNPELAPVLMILLPGVLMMAGAALAMTALAFVKIAGETLLGAPRDPQVAASYPSGDVPWSMRFIMSLLAGLCLVLGVAPGLLIPWLALAITGLGYDPSALQVDYSGLTITVPTSTALSYTAALAIWPLVALAVMPLVITLTAGVWHKQKPLLRSPVWAGGERHHPDTMQYSGSALSALVWGWLASSRPVLEEPLPSRFKLAENRWVIEPFNYLYNLFIRVLLGISAWVGNYLQSGDIRRYLLYIFAALIIVLVLLGTSR
jgi:hydrogenase-4 component B